jgi:hypothetical protein
MGYVSDRQGNKWEIWIIYEDTDSISDKGGLGYFDRYHHLEGSKS